MSVLRTATLIGWIILAMTQASAAEPMMRIIPLGKLSGVHVRKPGGMSPEFRGKMWTDYPVKGAFGNGVITEKVGLPLQGEFEPVPAGSYAVMLRGYDYGRGVNVVEVEVNGVKGQLTWGDTHPKSYRWLAKTVLENVPAGGKFAIALRQRGQSCAMLDIVFITADLKAELPSDDALHPLDTPPVPPEFQVRVAGHPLLLFTAEDLPRLRALPFDSSAADAAFAATSFIQTCWGATKVTHELPPKQPGVIPNPVGWKSSEPYPYWTGMAGGITKHMDALTYAALHTGKPEYIAKARDYLLAFSKWTTWTDPQEGGGMAYSNSTRIIATAVVFAYDVLFDWLSEAEKREVEDAMLRNGCEVFERGSRSFGSPRYPAHSTQAFGEPSPMGLMALTMYDRRPEARKYLARCWQLVKMSLDTQMTTPHTEGLMYTRVGMRPMLVFGDALARITGDTSIVAHPYFREIFPYLALYFTAPRKSGLPNFADSTYQPDLLPTIKTAQAYIQDPRINQHLREHFQAPAGGLLSVHCFTPVGPSQDYADLPLDRAFNMGWVALRSAWRDEDGTLFAFNSSPSELGHCHRDANSFVVNVAGQWLATDPGYHEPNPGPDRDFSDGTEGHNSVTVDGQGQCRLGGGKIADFFTSPELAYVLGDAASGYTADLLKTFRRHVIYVRPDYFLVFDEMESDGTPRSFASLLHTDTQGRLSVSGATVLIEKNRQRLWTQVLMPSSPEIETAASARYGPYVRIRAPEKFVKGHHLMLLTPQPAAERTALAQPPAQGEARQEGRQFVVIVRLASRQDTVVINPARVSFNFRGQSGNGPVLLIRDGKAYTGQ